MMTPGGCLCNIHDQLMSALEDMLSVPSQAALEDALLEPSQANLCASCRVHNSRGRCL